MQSRYKQPHGNGKHMCEVHDSGKINKIRGDASGTSDVMHK